MKTKNYILTALLTIVTLGLNAQQNNINAEASNINWLGKKIIGQHDGAVKLKSGSLIIENNQITGGAFTIDMQSITCNDIEDPENNGNLVGHLKNDDFFGVANHPTATLKITKATAFKDSKATVTGEFTIKSKTQTINFEVIKEKESYSAKIEIDRTKHDIKYGSASFFDSLGDKAIDNIFTLDVKLVLN